MENIYIPHSGQIQSPLVGGGGGELQLGGTRVLIKSNIGKIDLKLFVGQIPKTWDDRKVAEFFSEMGEILEARVQRKNQQHQGCAFVKFASMSQAEQAIEKLRNVYIPGCSDPIQLKWADGEEERLGVNQNTLPKLFVGSLPREATEQNLRDVFSSYGEIDECYIMVDDEKMSKGCAFVKFKNCESALLAIRELNARACLCGSDKPIEVRFADKKKPYQHQQYQQQHQHQQQPYQQQQQQYKQQQYKQQQYTHQQQQQYPVYYECFTEGSSIPFYYNSQTQQSQWEKPPFGTTILPQSLLNTTTSSSTNTSNNSILLDQQSYISKYGGGGNMKQGPPGCNLFIFHLPNEWTVHDLQTHFCQFGNIISARIMTNRDTGKSKGFGFISYDQPDSAARAIQTMNGVAVLNKRLKVELKQGPNEHEHDTTTTLHSNLFNTQYRPY